MMNGRRLSGRLVRYVFWLVSESFIGGGAMGGKMKGILSSCIFVASLQMISFSSQAETNQILTVSVSNVVPRVISVMSQDQQCEAITKSGKRCKRNKAQGQKFCRQHQLMKR